MSESDLESLRASLAGALREALQAGRGVPSSLESVVGDYARALRLEGVAIEKAIIDVKALVLAQGNDRDLIFTSRVVGWAVAGYFAGTASKDQ